MLGRTDCLWLTLTVLQALEIPAPTYNPEWYLMSTQGWLRELLLWGDHIDMPTYDGDVIIEARERAFCIVWRNRGS